VAVFLIVLTRGPAAVFVYDAQVYWMLTDSLAHGKLLDLRGIWADAVYLPVAVIARLTPGNEPYRLVLWENAVLLALLAVAILPTIIGRIVPAASSSGRTTLACAVLVAVTLRGFAPYPLMDLAAAVVAFAAIALLLTSPRWWVLVLSGVLLGVAVYLRPAYLIPVALGYAVWLWSAGWRCAALPLAGAAMALIPQLAVNVIQRGLWLPVPTVWAAVKDVQFRYAGYVTRYDTVTSSAATNPRQFFCDPDQAASLVGQHIIGAADLLAHLAQQAPSSLLFVGRKIGASLLWSPATPYANTSFYAVTALGLLVLLIGTVGITMLAVGWAWRDQRHGIAVLLAFVVGCMMTIVGATPEARFALPIVVAGVLGCAAAPGLIGPQRTRRIIAGTAAAVAFIIALLLGLSGIAHPAPPGEANAEICALVSSSP
jgi:hypothetical protein